MNRYGEFHSETLAKLEETLNAKVPGLEMNHFRAYEQLRKKHNWGTRLVTCRWLWQPRVRDVVNIFGVVLLLIEGYLIWIHYLQ